MSDVTTKPGKVVKWGNSAAVRLSAKTLGVAAFGVDDLVDVSAREGEIVIRRRAPRVTMAQLLANFDPQRHRHALAFDAEPVGVETR